MSNDKYSQRFELDIYTNVSSRSHLGLPVRRDGYHGNESYNKTFYCVPDTVLGRSFKSIMATIPFQDRNGLVMALKNVAHWLFNQENLLLNNYTNDDKSVRYHDNLGYRDWRFKGPDRMSCEGITIPLTTSVDYPDFEVELYVLGGNGQVFPGENIVGLRMRYSATSTWFKLPPVCGLGEFKALLDRFCKTNNMEKE